MSWMDLYNLLYKWMGRNLLPEIKTTAEAI